MSSIELLARDWLRRAGVVGFPGREGLERVTACAGGIRIHYREGCDFPLCWHRDDGSADIWVAPDDLFALAHECAHALLFDPALVQWDASRSLLVWERLEERRVSQFARALLLPSVLMWGPEDQIEEASGCPRWVVQDRRVDLAWSPAPSHDMPPAWRRRLRVIARRYGLHVSVDTRTADPATAEEFRRMLEALRGKASERAAAGV